jgi:uroporphyrinogen III methyltransferase / synthase
VATLDDPRVSVAVQAERAFLAAIGAGCTMPVGAHVHHGAQGLTLVAFIENDAGDRRARRHEVIDSADPADPADLVARIAREMQAEVGESSKTQWTGTSTVHRDLDGVTVAVTRPTRQAQPLIQILKERGALPLALPTIRIEPPENRAPLDAALRALAAGAFTWVVFTSANAVEAVVSAAADLGARDECLRAVRAATIGEATARAALDYELDVAIVAGEPTAEGLVASLVPRLQACDRVLYPRSAIGREFLPVALRDAGIDVTTVDAYRTVPESEVSPQAMAHLRSGDVDLILYSSPSSVSSLQVLLGRERTLIEHIPAICAGPVTAASVREAGLPVAMISDHPGPPAMVDAAAEFWLGRAHAHLLMNSIPDGAHSSERIAGR